MIDPGAFRLAVREFLAARYRLRDPLADDDRADIIARTTDHDGDGSIQLSEVVDEVSRRVSEATRGAQMPWLARRELIGDFAIAPSTR